MGANNMDHLPSINDFRRMVYPPQFSLSEVRRTELIDVRAPHEKNTRSPQGRRRLSVLLKGYQRLGCLPWAEERHDQVTGYLAECLKVAAVPKHCPRPRSRDY